MALTSNFTDNNLTIHHSHPHPKKRGGSKPSRGTAYPPSGGVVVSSPRDAVDLSRSNRLFNGGLQILCNPPLWRTVQHKREKRRENARSNSWRYRLFLVFLLLRLLRHSFLAPKLSAPVGRRFAPEDISMCGSGLNLSLLGQFSLTMQLSGFSGVNFRERLTERQTRAWDTGQGRQSRRHQRRRHVHRRGWRRRDAFPWARRRHLSVG